MTGVTLLLKNMIANNKRQTQIIDTVRQARNVATTFTNELRNAAYGINGAYPIGKADNFEIIFYSTTPKKDGTVSRVRYYVSNGVLYKGIINPSGNPLTYNTGTETSTALLTLTLGSSLLFYYYDGSYGGTGNALTQPININSIKFAKINLIISKNDIQGSTGTYTVTSGAAVRNLKTNL